MACELVVFPQLKFCQNGRVKEWQLIAKYHRLGRHVDGQDRHFLALVSLFIPRHSAPSVFTAGTFRHGCDP